MPDRRGDRRERIYNFARSYEAGRPARGFRAGGSRDTGEPGRDRRGPAYLARRGADWPTLTRLRFLQMNLRDGGLVRSDLSLPARADAASASFMGFRLAAPLMPDEFQLWSTSIDDGAAPKAERGTIPALPGLGPVQALSANDATLHL